MIKDEGDSDPTATTIDDKMASTPRTRKKVVTFASLSQLAEILALEASETHSLSSDDGKHLGQTGETTSQVSSDPNLFLNMPLEDYEVTCGRVSRIGTE